MRRINLIALWLFVFTIPWESMIAIPGVASIAWMTGILALVAGVANMLRRGHLRRPNSLHLCFVALLFAYTLSSLWSTDVPATFQVIATSLELFAMMWLIWESVETEEDFRFLLVAFVLGCGVSIVGTIYGMQTNSGAYVTRDSARYAAEGFDPNDLAVTLALAIPMSCYLALSARRLLSRLFFLYVFPSLAMLGVMLTASRGGALAAVASLSIIPWALRSRGGVMKVVVALTLLVVLAGALYIAPDSSWTRILGLREQFNGGTFTGRTEIWAAGLSQFSATPILGVGGGAYATTMQERMGMHAVSHNTFLTIAVELGMLGVVLMLAAAGASWRLLGRFETSTRYFWLVLLFTWAIGAFGLNWVYRKPTWFVFALLAAHTCMPAVISIWPIRGGHELDPTILETPGVHQ